MNEHRDAGRVKDSGREIVKCDVAITPGVIGVVLETLLKHTGELVCGQRLFEFAANEGRGALAHQHRVALGRRKLLDLRGRPLKPCRVIGKRERV